MNHTEAVQAPGHRIRQKRGQKTYEALVAAGFKLLETRDFDSITIAELAQEAGYSVGAFYARFRSKDEFLDALVVRHMASRRRARDRMIASATRDTLVHDVIKDLVVYYWKRRQFWRTALFRGMRDPTFWKPLQELGHETAKAVLDEIARLAQRELTETERTNVRFALHIAYGAINNSVVNRPGPILFLGQKRFIESLTRAFRLVADYDALFSARAPCSA